MKNYTILIIEDERAMAKALQLKLANEGFYSIVAPDGEKGCQLLKAGNFDLVLLDILMPVKDGFKILEKLKASDNKIPVIVISNYSQKHHIKRSKELGAREYLIKSNSSLSDIIKVINKVLSK